MPGQLEQCSWRARFRRSALATAPSDRQVPIARVLPRHGRWSLLLQLLGGLGLHARTVNSSVHAACRHVRLGAPALAAPASARSRPASGVVATQYTDMHGRGPAFEEASRALEEGATANKVTPTPDPNVTMATSRGAERGAARRIDRALGSQGSVGVVHEPDRDALPSAACSKLANVVPGRKVGGGPDHAAVHVAR